MTIKRGDKQIVKVTVEPLPDQLLPRSTTLLEDRVRLRAAQGNDGACRPHADRMARSQNQDNCCSQREGRSGAADASELSQTASADARNREAECRTRHLTAKIKEAYALAGTILADTATSAALMDKKVQPRNRTQPGQKLNDVQSSYDSLLHRLPDTSAGLLAKSTVTGQDRDKEITALNSPVPAVSGSFSKRSDEFTELLDRARGNASRLAALALIVANSMRRECGETAPGRPRQVARATR